MNTKSLLIVALVCAVEGRATAQTNLLPQGSFENPGINTEWAEGFHIPKNQEFQVVSKDGKHWLRMENRDPSRQLDALHAYVKVAPQIASLTVSVRMRAADLKVGKEGWHTARVALMFEGGSFGFPPVVPELTGDSDWVTKSVGDNADSGRNLDDADRQGYLVAQYVLNANKYLMSSRGRMVWDENRQRALERADVWMRHYRNHPSVIMWIAGFNFFNSAEDADPRHVGRRGWGQEDERWRRLLAAGDEMFEGLRKLDTSRAFYSHAKDHHFRPGQKIEKQVVLINETRQPQDFQASWAVTAGGSVVDKGQMQGRLAVSEIRFLPLEVTEPAVEAGGKTDGQISLEATIGGIKHDDRFAFRVFGADEPGSGQIAIVDPEGATSTMLAQLGYRTSSWNGASTPLAVIGRNALKEDAALANVSQPPARRPADSAVLSPRLSHRFPNGRQSLSLLPVVGGWLCAVVFEGHRTTCVGNVSD